VFLPFRFLLLWERLIFPAENSHAHTVVSKTSFVTAMSVSGRFQGPMNAQRKSGSGQRQGKEREEGCAVAMCFNHLSRAASRRAGEVSE
jgi:hypothetical protein